MPWCWIMWRWKFCFLSPPIHSSKQTVTYKLAFTVIRFSKTPVRTWLDLWNSKAILFIEALRVRTIFIIFLFTLKYPKSWLLFYFESIGINPSFRIRYWVIGIFWGTGVECFENFLAPIAAINLLSLIYIVSNVHTPFTISNNHEKLYALRSLKWSKITSFRDIFCMAI